MQKYFDGNFLLSVLGHLIILAIVLLFQFFYKGETIKATISVNLVSLPPPIPKEEPKENLQAKKLQTEEVVKQLPKLLQEEKKLVVNKNTATKNTPIKEKAPAEVKRPSAKENNEPVAKSPAKKVQNQPKENALAPINKKETTNNTVNAKAMSVPQQNTKVLQAEPARTPVPLPTPVTPLEQKEVVPSVPAKKTLVINKGDDSFSNFLDEKVEEISNAPKDLEENTDLNSTEKNSIRDQISKCWAGFSEIREKDVVFNLVLTMNADGSVKNVKVLRNKQTSDDNWLMIENRVKDVFSKPKCAKLTMPLDKYNSWKQFSVKLTLKGYFQ